MNEERARLVEMAAELLGQDTKPALAQLMECDGGDWYLRERIVKAPDAESVMDNSRVLKYAAHFHRNGATVTFVREETSPTPDLRDDVEACTFYV